MRLPKLRCSDLWWRNSASTDTSPWLGIGASEVPAQDTVAAGVLRSKRSRDGVDCAGTGAALGVSGALNQGGVAAVLVSLPFRSSPATPPCCATPRIPLLNHLPELRLLGHVERHSFTCRTGRRTSRCCGSQVLLTELSVDSSKENAAGILDKDSTLWKLGICRTHGFRAFQGPTTILTWQESVALVKGSGKANSGHCSGLVSLSIGIVGLDLGPAVGLTLALRTRDFPVEGAEELTRFRKNVFAYGESHALGQSGGGQSW